jgi:hypothetical protein
MKSYAIVWKPDAEARLTAMWTDNPRLRREITAAADEIEQRLAVDPHNMGIAKSPLSREVVSPPLNVLYAISDADRTCV